jgi:cytochrome c peroxidase
MSAISLVFARLPRDHSSALRPLCLTLMCAACAPEMVSAQSAAPSSPPSANSVSSNNVATPADAPAWFKPAYLHALRSPLPSLIHPPQGTPPVIPQLSVFPDLSGTLGNYQPTGPTRTADNAFFQSLGTNGRSCFTCHQTSDALSISAAHARALFEETGGHDPLFAPVDGANCPNQVPDGDTSGALVGGRRGSLRATDPRAAHSLLLNKGLFRIFLPVPAQAEYTIQVVSDPNGCNTDPAYNQEVDPTTGAVTQIISVYRRPLMSAALKFKTTTFADFPNSGFPPFDPRTGGTLPVDPTTGLFESLNIMWDGREPTLESQAANAVLIHSQATTPPSSAQVAQMIAFQNGIFSAQGRLGPVELWEDGANGGPIYLSGLSPLSVISPSNPPPLDYFDAWSNISPTSPATQLRASIARGQKLFETFPFAFNLGNVSGFGCGSCHDQSGGGESASPGGQRNTGVGGQSARSNGPAPDPTLPIFKLTCAAGVPVGNDGSVVTTNDPGLALITGKCGDIGAFTIPPLRGLAARAPYFHDGSATTILDIVNFYDKRFSIGFTDQQKQDLVNFLAAL